MTEKKRLPPSIRKHIRREKARIRREVSGGEERKKLIKNLYRRFLKEEEGDNKNN